MRAALAPAAARLLRDRVDGQVVPGAGLVPADAQHARPRQGRDGLEEEELLLRQQLRPLRRLLHRRARLHPAGADGETERRGTREGGEGGDTQITQSALFIDCLSAREGRREERSRE